MENLSVLYRGFQFSPFLSSLNVWRGGKVGFYKISFGIWTLSTIKFMKLHWQLKPREEFVGFRFFSGSVQAKEERVKKGRLGFVNIFFIFWRFRCLNSLHIFFFFYPIKIKFITYFFLFLFKQEIYRETIRTKVKFCKFFWRFWWFQLIEYKVKVMYEIHRFYISFLFLFLWDDCKSSCPISKAGKLFTLFFLDFSCNRFHKNIRRSNSWDEIELNRRTFEPFISKVASLCSQI